LDYDEALEYLDRHISLEALAGKYEGLSLDAMSEIAHTWGDPQHAYPAIHITGTNGKGSTARMVTRLLMAQGLTVGTYTIPHLEHYNERLRWNDEPISDEAFAHVLGELADIEGLLSHTPSHFECLTAAAFAWFAEQAVDVGVIEVGVMGRFDATNIIEADVAVITNVGRDHTDFEGDWRRAIAQEKAGIIKPKSTLVLGETATDLRDVFVGEGPARTWVRGEDFDVTTNRVAVGGRVLDLRTPYHTVDEVFLPLHGGHQGDNAAIALAATEAFFDRPLDPDLVADGFATVEVAGRFEVLGRNPLVIIDGAHNPDGAEAAARVLDDTFTVDGVRVLVVGMLTGRDPADMLRGFDAAQFDLVIACTPPSPRALPADELAAVARSIGVPARAASTLEEGLDWALRDRSPDDLVLVTGSLYLVGNARTVLRTRLGRP
jgi:dihydrofolate synthase/folylpolyglutamate synthase